MLIRYSGPSDLTEIHHLIEQLEEQVMDREDFKNIFLRNLGTTGIYYFTGEADGKIVGFVSLHIQSLLHHNGEVAEVQELCIDENYRNKGFGKLLLEHVASIAKNRGCELIEVSANRKRKAAHRFYERGGWKRSHYKFTLPLK